MFEEGMGTMGKMNSHMMYLNSFAGNTNNVELKEECDVGGGRVMGEKRGGSSEVQCFL